MTNSLTDNLIEMKINLDDLRCQNYDNEANKMRENSGVPTRMLEINPQPFIIPCNAHSLNLVTSI